MIAYIYGLYALEICTATIWDTFVVLPGRVAVKIARSFSLVVISAILQDVSDLHQDILLLRLYLTVLRITVSPHTWRR